MDIKEQILVALGLNKDDKVKLAFQAKTEDGTTLVSTAEELESGVDISVLTDDGTTILLPVGTYKLDTGVSFRVEEEGIVAEVMESETEEEIEAEDDKEEMKSEADEAYEKAEFENKNEELDHKPGHDEEYAEEFPETPAEKADWAKTYEEMKTKVQNLEDAVDDEKRMLVSPALIPNKQIFRYDANTDSEYYVYFSPETVRQASELYLKHNNHHKATYEHQDRVSGVLTVESWIKEGDMDKSKLYGYDLPNGTWFVKMKITNSDLWNKIKAGELKGLSIEGYFTDKMEKMSIKTPSDLEILEALNEIINENQTNNN
jgi:hypothetical protein